jgi:hypothetical protein
LLEREKNDSAPLIKKLDVFSAKKLTAKRFYMEKRQYK